MSQSRPCQPFVALFALALIACTPPTTITPEDDAGSLLDAGGGGDDDAGAAEDAGPAACNANLPIGPPCCNEAGARLSDADCGNEGWTCDEGALCECEGEAASFFCTDVCGSDAFTDAQCATGGWTCGQLIQSDTCDEDLCWGLPGDCCINPSCVDGQWQCESIQDPCE